MCGLIAHTLKHRDKPRRPVVVQMPPGGSAPYGRPCESPSMKEEIHSPTRASMLGTREASFSSSSPRWFSERSSRNEGRVVSEDVAVGIAGAVVGRNNTSPTAVWRSPPRVKRVTSEKEALPALARRSQAGRRLRARRRQERVGLSSSYLAAAIGCRTTPAATNDFERREGHARPRP